MEFNPYLLVYLQPVPWATSSLFRAPFPALCVPQTAEPARRGRVCVNVAVVSTEQPTMLTLLPAQVSFVCLFVFFLAPWEVFKGPQWTPLSFTQTVRANIVQPLTRIHPPVFFKIAV